MPNETDSLNVMLDKIDSALKYIDLQDNRSYEWTYQCGLLTNTVGNFLCEAFCDKDCTNSEYFINLYEPYEQKVLTYDKTVFYENPIIELLIGSYKNVELFKVVFLDNNVQYFELTEDGNKIYKTLEPKVKQRDVYFDDLLDYIDQN